MSIQVADTNTIYTQQVFQRLDAVQADIEAIKKQLKYLP